MSPSASAPSAPPSIFDLVVTRLSAGARVRFKRLFDAYHETHAGKLYAVGSIMLDAWKAETDISDDLAEAIAELVEHVLRGSTLSAFPAPTCCVFHKTCRTSRFGDPTAYPREDHLLLDLSELIWAVLPATRAIVSMEATTTSTVPTSKFLTLDAFVKRHDATAGDAVGYADAVTFYERHCAADQEPAVRQGKLRRRVKAGDLHGLIGSRPLPDPVRTATGVRFCQDNRPFSASEAALGLAPDDRHRAPPDKLLRKLGLYFDAADRYVEMVYDVPVDSLTFGVAPRTTVPSVLDASGYWLFRPDREKLPDMLWNHTRDVSCNLRGARELITLALPIDHLVDLIVWTHPTAAHWSVGAAPALSTDLLV